MVSTMNDIPQEKHQWNCQGIFIPQPILDSEELSWLEKYFFSVIDNLSCNEKGCFASNNFFAKKFKVSIRQISTMLNHLIEKKLVKIINFDGRHRVMTSIPQNVFLLKSSKYPDSKKEQILDKEKETISMLPGRKLLGSQEENFHAPLYKDMSIEDYITKEREKERNAALPSKGTAPPPTLENEPKKEKLIDIEKFKTRFPDLDILSELESAQNWLKANGKSKKDFNAYFINWCKNAPNFKPQKSVSKFQNVKDKKSDNITYLIDFKDNKGYKQLNYGERFAGDPETNMKVLLTEDCEIFKAELEKMWKKRQDIERVNAIL